MNIEKLVSFGESLVKEKIDALGAETTGETKEVTEALLNQIVDICAMMITEYDKSKQS